MPSKKKPKHVHAVVKQADPERAAIASAVVTAAMNGPASPGDIFEMLMQARAALVGVNAVLAVGALGRSVGGSIADLKSLLAAAEGTTVAINQLDRVAEHIDAVFQLDEEPGQGADEAPPLPRNPRTTH